MLFLVADIQLLPDTNFVQSSVGLPYHFSINAMIADSPGFSLEALSIALVMPNPTLTTFVGFTFGPDLQDLNGGNGPDFVMVDTADYGGLTGNVLRFQTIHGGSFPLAGEYEIAEFEFVSGNANGSFFSLGSFPSVPPAETSSSYIDTPGGPLLTDTAGTVHLIFQLITDAAFLRGDVNQDFSVSISDSVYLLDVLFATQSLPCADSADVNDDGSMNIADAITLLGYLFASGPPPADPFPLCAPDSTADMLFCSVPQC